MPFRKKCVKKDVVEPMSLPGGAVVCVQNFGIDPFSGFQLMSFYTDRQTDRQTTLRFYIYIGFL